MTRNLAWLLDHLELPAPVAVGMVLVTAALAKSGQLYWAIGGMIAFHALFIIARHSLTRFNVQRAAIVSAPAAKRPDLSLVSTEPVESSSLASPVLPRDPPPSAAHRAAARKAA